MNAELFMKKGENKREDVYVGLDGNQTWVNIRKACFTKI